MTATTTRPPAHYVAVKDLAARWGEHPNTVYMRVRTPEWVEAVRTIQLGRQLRFLETDVDAFEEAHRLTPETIAAALGEEQPAAPAREPGEPPATEFGPRRPPASRKAAA